jgi:hypothetical protein
LPELDGCSSGSHDGQQIGRRDIEPSMRTPRGPDAKKGKKSSSLHFWRLGVLAFYFVHRGSRTCMATCLFDSNLTKPESLNSTITLVALLSVISLAPAIILMVTSFAS